MDEQFGTSEPGLVIQPCPLAKPRGTHWIAIRLLDEENAPVPWEEYEVTLPDGNKVRGVLDAAGSARIGDIDDPGNCRITFPGLDQDAWVRVGDEVRTT